MFTFPALCLLAGLGRATYHARDAIKAGAQGGNLSPASTSVTSRSISSGTGTHGSASSVVSVTAEPITASLTQGIYHRNVCDWAMKITPSNRVKFTSPVEAQAAGYRACKVCAP
ncbi:MAG: Ada metal-binding domain-containing protein [Pyrinomonadaceae bacterium]